MTIYATLDASGRPTGFYMDDIHNVIPDGVIEITETQWLDCIENQGRRAFIDGKLVEVELAILPFPGPRIIYKADIFRRADDSEAETIVAILGQQTIRLQQIWANAQYISTDDDFYPMIEGAFIQAFGAQRAAELLA